MNKIYNQHDPMTQLYISYPDKLSPTNIELFILSDDYDDIIITYEDLWES